MLLKLLQVTHQDIQYFNGNPFLSSAKTFVVEIDTTKLDYGQNYTLELDLQYKVQEICVFYYDFTMNYAPLANYLGVTPNFGEEASTQFTLTVNNPIDIDGNYPLTYSFGYIFEGQYVFLSSLSQSPTFTFTLVYLQQNVKLFAYIYDSLGDYSEYTTLLSLQIDSNFDASAYYNQKTVSSFTFYPELPIKIANMINSVIGRSYYLTGFYSDSNPQLLQKTFETVINLIEQYINISVASSNNVDQVLSMIYSLTANPYLISNQNANMTKQELSLLYALNSNNGISIVQAQKAIAVANDSLILDRVMIYNNTNGIYTVIQMLQNTVIGMLNQLVSDRLYVLSAGKLEVNLKVVDVQSLSKFSITSNNNPNVYASFPDKFTLPNLLSSEKIIVSLTYLNSIADKTLSTPTVVSLDLYLLSDHSHISVSNLQSPINISIPIYNINTTDIKCYYLNTDTRRWNTTGCEVGNIGKNFVICSCKHLSSFSAGNSLENLLLPDSNIEGSVSGLSTINDTTAIGIYYCGGIIAIFLTIAVIAIVQDSKDINILLWKKTNLSLTQLTNSNKNWNSSIESEKNVRESSEGNEIIKHPVNVNLVVVNFEDNEKDLEVFEETKRNSEENKKNSELVEAYKDSENSNKENDFSSQSIEKKSLNSAMIDEHPILNIFLVQMLDAPRLIRTTLQFLDVVGKMYFIGLFYDWSQAEASGIVELFESYAVEDLLILVYSSLIMFGIVFMCQWLSKLKKIDIVEHIDVILRTIKRNNRKKGIALVIGWAGIGYFVWNIILFSLSFHTSVSYKWIFNTSLILIIKLFFTSFFVSFFKLFLIFPVVNAIKNKRKKKIEYRQINPI